MSRPSDQEQRDERLLGGHLPSGTCMYNYFLRKHITNCHTGEIEASKIDD